jgi:hypothetical protein
MLRHTPIVGLKLERQQPPKAFFPQLPRSTSELLQQLSDHILAISFDLSHFLNQINIDVSSFFLVLALPNRKFVWALTQLIS